MCDTSDYGNADPNLTAEWYSMEDVNFTQEPPDHEEHYRHVVYNIVIPIILGFGMIGNLASLVIFSQKRLRHVFDEIEQSATVGLVALAVSDFCFCLCGFPACFLNKQATENSSMLALPGFYYRTYQMAFFNMFLFTSTWITVLVAMERYVAVCHPFRAQSWIRVHRTAIACVLVYLISVALSVPHFLAVNIVMSPCSDSCANACYTYVTEISHYISGGVFDDIYRICMVMLGMILPFILLAFCNVSLICAIQKSKTRGIVDPERYSTSRITMVLVVIICLCVVLVCPSMALTVITDHLVSKTNNWQYRGYNVAIYTFNMTQAVNFSINFLLYFAMCKQFRAMITVRMCRKPFACKQKATHRPKPCKPNQPRYQPVKKAVIV